MKKWIIIIIGLMMVQAVNAQVAKLTFNVDGDQYNISQYILLNNERYSPQYKTLVFTDRKFGFTYNDTWLDNLYQCSSSKEIEYCSSLSANKRTCTGFKSNVCAGGTWSKVSFDKKIYFELQTNKEGFELGESSPYQIEATIPNKRNNELGYITKRKIDFSDIFNKEDNLYNITIKEMNVSECTNENCTQVNLVLKNVTIKEPRNIRFNLTRNGRTWTLEFYNTFDLDPAFVEDTEANWTSWTNFNTNMTGVGKDANITLNWTYLSGGGCAECGNMSRGQKNYTLRGNASKVFDTGDTTSKHDKIFWKSDLPNGSDVVGYIFHATSQDAGVLYNNGSIGVDLSVTSSGATNVFTGSLRKYSIPSGWSYNDIVASVWDDSAANDAHLFFRNGSIVTDTDQSDLTTDLSFTVVNKYTIPKGFNTSDIIGVVLDLNGGGDTTIMFKNLSHVYVNDMSPPLQFTEFFSYTLPAGISSDNGIGMIGNGGGVAMFIMNGSVNSTHYNDGSVVGGLNQDFDFSSKLNDAYFNYFNTTESTNITLRTAISNDSVTWSASTEHIYENGSGFDTNSGAHIGRYVEITAMFTSPDKYITPSFENVTINYTIPEAEVVIPPLVNTCIPPPGTSDHVINRTDCIKNYTINLKANNSKYVLDNGIDRQTDGTLRASRCIFSRGRFIHTKGRLICG